MTEAAEETGASAPELPSLEALLDSIPLTVHVWPEVDLEVRDPAEMPDGRRMCVATKRAGGRCTAPPLRTGLCCTPHSGLLDSAAGGQAKALKAKEAAETAEERARVARLGVRGAIADRMQQRIGSVRRTIDVLLDAAEQGDLAAAKLVIPYLNQGLGQPTERVEVTQPQSGADLDTMGTAALEEYVASRRAARLQPVETDAA